MRTFDVQGIDLDVSRDQAFGFIADPGRLPQWTQAFAQVDGRKAVMRTPDGEVPVDLEVRASLEQGTVDWHMTFPDRSIASAYSRVVKNGHDHCVFSFVLTPPPVPLEQLEGALESQSRTLAEELRRLKGILERDE